MIFDVKPQFVLSRDGYILYQEETVTPFESYVKVGPSVLSYDSHYHFVMNASYDILMRRLRAVTELNFIMESAKLLSTQISQLKSGRLRKHHEAVLHGLKRQFDFIIDKYKITSEVTDRFASIASDGAIYTGYIAYSVDEININGISHVNANRSFSELFVEEGTEWVLCTNNEDSTKLEAAMRSTQTKEELLLLLRKLGAIGAGEWIKPREFYLRNEVSKHSKNVRDAIFNSNLFNVESVVKGAQ
jgi:hypothetical protein